MISEKGNPLAEEAPVCLDEDIKCHIIYGTLNSPNSFKNETNSTQFEE